MSYVAPHLRNPESSDSHQGKFRGKKSREQHQDKYRGKMNQKVLDDFRAENRAIIFGTEEPIEDQFKPVKYDQQIPITTCGIGLATQVTYAKLASRPEITNNLSIHSLYRVSLIQAQLQLVNSQQRSVSNIFHRRQFQDLQIERQMRECVLANAKNFSLISGVINSLGNFQQNGIHFKIGIPNHFPTWSNITISNLRHVVEQLHAGDPNYTANFMANNCLPGGLWDANHLINPNDIMPAQYTPELMRMDFQAVAAAFDVVGRKIPSLRVLALSFSGEGHCAQLVTDLENPPIILPRFAVDDGIVTRYPTAATSTYCSSMELSDIDFRIAIILQAGRCLDGEAQVVDFYQWRTTAHVVYALDRTYIDVARYYVE